MNKEFIPYEQALELKELGFDEQCLAFYDGKGTEQVYFNSYRNGSGDYEPFKESKRLTWFGAPLYQQAFRWFREKYGLHVTIDVPFNNKYRYWISDIQNISLIEWQTIGNYEEAELACLKKLIEIAKQLIVNTSQRISDEVDKMVVEEMINIAKSKYKIAKNK